ncbi:MAG: hypothetical protein K0R54_1839 [Clostridiaceae bacterium]|jgi:hypothetical protein|nr:hypothetical protein [Clostridiaceae bacterium]
MGEYIKNRNHVEDEEIKIGVYGYTEGKITTFYPLDMLKEFKFLGYEDFYADKFTDNDTSTLDEMIENYDTKVVQWREERPFFEMVFTTKEAEDFITKSLKDGDYNILKLHRNNKPAYIVSEYYKVQLTENNVGISFIPYEYQFHIVQGGFKGKDLTKIPSDQLCDKKHVGEFTIILDFAYNCVTKRNSGILTENQCNELIYASRKGYLEDAKNKLETYLDNNKKTEN